jgi:2-aminoethylphosphonate-pyruvate transaminase
MICLTPGPVNVSERVRAALQRPVLSPGEPEFSDLMQGIRQKLVKAFVPGAEAEYTAVLMTGSGGAAVEAALLSSLPHGKRALIINNGLRGERLSAIVGIHRLGVAEFKLDWATRPDPERLRLALRQHPEVHVVAMAHHETMTGRLNPVKEMAEVADSLNRVFVLDSVAGLGAEELDVAGPHLYMVAGTADTGLQGLPGVSFVIVRKGFMEKMKTYPKRSWYLHLPHYYENEERGMIPFTPAVQIWQAFDEALNELLEEGVASRIQRYGKAAMLIRNKAAALGLKPVLPAEAQSNSLTVYYLPDGLTYAQLHDRLKAQGFLVAPAEGALEDKAFRLANMGALTQADIGQFLAALESAVKAG